ncbi:helix-turn-helix transcriptional regulator [Paenibacillus aurantius]|uniref:Helix-turn-helix transcriptional regulator n=1 Tax=Paenibacillus aurantius TaxID=2918900 RepID=A0AA96LCB3_9BACL|nr:helix-turn-helix transcriptional regulator [Paenibacillus aurantius]WJH35228.1 helix-turn-helix transcriptional regulator [Paenibacillus sp. CC-CFT747]WNQ10504.1 helix-turn-helix transcriptional regulator [Paenibacillus aurantius]
MKNRIRELRAGKGWTQEKLSELAGVSRQTIISVENGKFNPSLTLAYTIARAFGLTIEEIFIFEEEGRERS